MMRAVGVQMAGSIFCSAVSFVLVLYLARVLGTASFGAYTAVLGLAMVSLPLIECGWPMRLYRESVDAGAAGAVRIDLALGHALAAGGVLVACALLAWMAGSSNACAVVFALATMTGVAIANFVSARLRGGGRFAFDALWQSSGRVASALAIVAAVLAFGARIPTILAAWAAALLVAALCARRWLAAPRWRGLAAVYPALLPLLAVEVGSAMLFKGDVALFAAVGAEPRTLSLYAACARLGETALLLAAPLANVAFRRFRMLREECDAFRAELRRLLALSITGGSLAVLGALAAGRTLMALLFGAEFGAAGELLPWVALAWPFALANLILVQALLARGREVVLWRALAAAAALGALLMAVLAGRFGAVGAAVALCLAHATMFGAAMLDLREKPACM